MTAGTQGDMKTSRSHGDGRKTPNGIWRCQEEPKGPWGWQKDSKEPWVPWDHRDGRRTPRSHWAGSTNPGRHEDPKGPWVWQKDPQGDMEMPGGLQGAMGTLGDLLMAGGSLGSWGWPEDTRRTWGPSPSLV